MFARRSTDEVLHISAKNSLKLNWCRAAASLSRLFVRVRNRKSRHVNRIYETFKKLSKFFFLGFLTFCFCKSTHALSIMPHSHHIAACTKFTQPTTRLYVDYVDGHEQHEIDSVRAWQSADESEKQVKWRCFEQVGKRKTLFFSDADSKVSSGRDSNENVNLMRNQFDCVAM